MIRNWNVAFCTLSLLIGASALAQKKELGSVFSVDTPLAVQGATVEMVADGFRFTEGPVCGPDGTFYFSDLHGGKIWKILPGADSPVEVAKDVMATNGLFLDRDGFLFACCPVEGSVVRLGKDGKSTAVASAYQGKRFNAPNDLWVDKNGGVYFTDPLYGTSRDEQGCQGVYYITPKGEVVRMVDDLVKPNGLACTPDGKRLYVADHAGKKTYLYDIGRDGKLENCRLFTDTGSDGMTVDKAGNVYLTSGRVWIFSPEGKPMGSIRTPVPPTNLCFGGPDGKTLCITARSAVYKVEMSVEGMRKVKSKK